MEPPFLFRATEHFRLCGRVLAPDDEVAIYPGYGIYPILNVPPNYGAVAGALGEGSLVSTTRHLSPDAFAAAVGLDPPPAPRQPCASTVPRRWGARLHRARAGLFLVKDPARG